MIYLMSALFMQSSALLCIRGVKSIKKSTCLAELAKIESSLSSSRKPFLRFYDYQRAFTLAYPDAKHVVFSYWNEA